MRKVRTLVLHAQRAANRTLSYQQAWPRHFADHPRFATTLVNILELRANRLTRVRTRVRPREFDAVVLLHSVFSNSNLLQSGLYQAIRRLRIPKAYFIGNEYKALPEKMAFCEELGIDLLVSQFTVEPPLRLYRERLPDVVVTGIPNTGWDPSLFCAKVPPSERPIDVGYRSFDNDFALGHQERRDLAERFGAAATRRGLIVDISLDAADRFDEAGWAGFLNRCKAQLGSEAGGDYFELTDRTRSAVSAYLADRPDATFEEVWSRFFRDYHDAVTGRILSGRNVEAAGTRTVQVLLEGQYGGYLEPDEHYIALRKDFSNLDEAIEKLDDEELCERLRRNAFEVARDLTYPRLIDRFHDALAPLLA
jgi:hypothetical protein